MSLAIVARLHALELRVKELEEKLAEPVIVTSEQIDTALANLQAKKPKKKHASKAH